MPLIPDKFTSLLEVTPLQVEYIRGDRFFVRQVSVPKGLNGQELHGFIELSLEERSPFPMERLFYGFYVCEESESAVIYAAYKRCFTAEEMQKWERVEFVLPDFFPLLGLTYESDTIALVVSDASLSALSFQAGQVLPQEVVSRALSDPLDIEAVKQQLIDLLGGLKSRPVVLYAPDAEGNPSEEKGMYRLPFTKPKETDVDPVEIEQAEDTLWRGDLRDASFITSKRRQKRLNHGVWKVALGLVVIMGLFALGEILMLGGKAYVKYLDKTTMGREAEVAEIEEKKSVVQELENFERSNLIPFDMISAISPVLPRSIHFTRLKTAGRNSLEIECKTTNLAEVTTYKNGLEGLLKIESAEVRNLQSAGGEGSFILMVNFKADAFEVSRNQLQNDGAVTVTEGELLEAVKGGRNES